MQKREFVLWEHARAHSDLIHWFFRERREKGACGVERRHLGTCQVRNMLIMKKRGRGEERGGRGGGEHDGGESSKSGQGEREETYRRGDMSPNGDLSESQGEVSRFYQKVPRASYLKEKSSNGRRRRAQ